MTITDYPARSTPLPCRPARRHSLSGRFPTILGWVRARWGLSVPSALPVFYILLFVLFFPLTGWAGPSTEAVRALQQDLASRNSATETLQTRCPTRIHIRNQATSSETSHARIPQWILPLLGVSPTDKIAIRHVQLLCGTVILSDAYNYYLPARLNRKTRQILADGHTPFGVAVGGDNFIRQTLSSILMAPSSPHKQDHPYVLENRALLFLKKSQNPAINSIMAPIIFSVVIERYTSHAVP